MQIRFEFKKLKTNLKMQEWPQRTSQGPAVSILPIVGFMDNWQSVTYQMQNGFNEIQNSIVDNFGTQNGLKTNWTPCPGSKP